ncbi:MAG: hypothetical protein JW908_05795 [Anaerolineales bacterium]|nr:hypothetical protein [Anaerolineales bacterium]
MLLQTQSTAIRPLTTAHLAQTMTLLGLTSVELYQKIETELASNPALELAPERRCPHCRRILTDSNPCPVCTQPSNSNIDEPIVYVSSREDFLPTQYSTAISENPEEGLTPDIEDLPTYVLRQIAPDLNPDDHFIAAHVLTSLDDDGLLRTPLAEIARYHHVPVCRIEDVIYLIKHSDPLGVGSQSPQEALLVQLEVLAEQKPIPPHTAEAIEEGMDLLSRRQYGELGHKLHIPLARVKDIANFISENLNPYPGRAHWGDIRQGSSPTQDVYYHPDIIISSQTETDTSPLTIEVISPLAGRLRINPLFREALHDAPEEKAEQWQGDLDRAALLVKCLQQRNNTLVRLMQRLAVIQRSFILEGDSEIAPITRASLAEKLGVHESTVSRAVSGKAVQLPSGRMVPLSKFFDRSLHIRTALMDIIARETKPLTDTQIAKILDKQGYPVARRTVAKYRAMEGILPAYLRSKNKPNFR